MSKNKDKQSTGLMPFLAFVAVLLIGIWATIVFIINQIDGITIDGPIVGLLNAVGVALGAIVAAVYSFRFARARGMVWFIIWVLAVIVIVVFIVLGIVI